MNLLTDLIDIATAPLKITIAVTEAIVRPVAEVTREIVEAFKDEVRESK